MGVIKRQGLKSSLINYIGVAIGALFFLIIFPQILDKKYLGFYQLILSVTLVFAQLPLLGMPNILFKYYENFIKEKRLGSYNTFALISILFGCLVFTLLYFIFDDFIISFYSKKSPLFETYYYIVPPLVLLQAFSNYFEYFSMMKMRVAFPTFLREIVTRALVIIILFSLALNLITEGQFVLLYVIAFCTTLLFLLVYVKSYLKIPFGNPLLYRKNNTTLKEQFDYGFSAMSTIFISTLQNFADAIMIPIYLGLGTLGVYGRPLILGQMIHIPYRSIAHIAWPVFMQAWHDNDVKKIESLNKKLSINLLLIGLFLFSLVVVNGDNFFSLLPASYLEGKNVLYIIAFGKLLDMSFGLNSEILFSSKYYRWIVWITLTVLILTIGLNMLLIPLIGMEGAAIAATFSLISFNIMKSVIIYNKFKFHCFSKHYLTLIFIAIIAIIVALIIPNFNSTALNENVGNNIMSIIVNSIIKSTVVVVTFIFPTLYFKVSPDFNDFFKLVISGKIFKGGHKMEEL